MESIHLGAKFDWNEGWESDFTQIKCISRREREFTNAWFKQFINHITDEDDAFTAATKMFVVNEEQPSEEELGKLRKKFLRQLKDFKQAFAKARKTTSNFASSLGNQFWCIFKHSEGFRYVKMASFPWCP